MILEKGESEQKNTEAGEKRHVNCEYGSHLCKVSPKEAKDGKSA